MQKSNFIYQILSYPFFYILSQKLMSSLSFNESIVKKYVKKKFINILDVGCGPADILNGLDHINYYGYDINESYINFAKNKYKHKKPKLFCKKFSNKEIKITIMTNSEYSIIYISDDGPGFPKDIIDKIGEPYIKSKLNKDSAKAGLGLGTFIGKTLLEKNNAQIKFKNLENNQGALVEVRWLNSDLKKI